VIERASLVAATALIIITLSGCATDPGPAATVTAEPAPAATVTATAVPASGDTPLDSLRAWTACAGFLMTYSGLPGGGGVRVPEQNSYSPDLVTQTGDSFRVQLAGMVGEPRYYCTVSGTYGAPIISDWITQQ